MRARHILAALAAIVAAAATATSAEAATAPELISRNDSGSPFSGGGGRSIVSDDGKRVAFFSQPDDLLPAKIYVRDRATGKTKRVFQGAQDFTRLESFSGNGRYVAATEHIDDVGLDPHIIDVVDGSDEGVGVEANQLSLSDSGRKVAFVDNGVVYVRNLDTRRNVRVTSTSSPAFYPKLSGDGTTVAYWQYGHVYTRNLSTGKLARIDVKPDGTFGPRDVAEPVAISDNGAWVLFFARSAALLPGTEVCDDDEPDLDGCYFRRNVSGSTTLLTSVLPDGQATLAFGADLSGDGRVVAFSAGPAGDDQIYVRTLSTATTRLASVNAAGQPANAGMSWPSLSQTGGLVTASGRPTNFGYPELGASQVWLLRGK